MVREPLAQNLAHARRDVVKLRAHVVRVDLRRPLEPLRHQDRACNAKVTWLDHVVKTTFWTDVLLRSQSKDFFLRDSRHCREYVIECATVHETAHLKKPLVPTLTAQPYPGAACPTGRERNSPQSHPSVTGTPPPQILSDLSPGAVFREGEDQDCQRASETVPSFTAHTSLGAAFHREGVPHLSPGAAG